MIVFLLTIAVGGMQNVPQPIDGLPDHTELLFLDVVEVDNRIVDARNILGLAPQSPPQAVLEGDRRPRQSVLLGALTSDAGTTVRVTRLAEHDEEDSSVL